MTRVTAEGIYFTVPGLFGTKYEWGPATWSHNLTTAVAVGDHGAHAHYGSVDPPVGATVLVVWALAAADPGQAVPWVLAWRP